MFAGKIFVAKSTYDSDSVLSTATAASDKVLVPGSGSDGSSTLAGQSETSGAVSEDPQVYLCCSFYSDCYSFKCNLN